MLNNWKKNLERRDKMPTDEVKKLIVDGDIFMQDKDGEISKIAEI